jgi:hypothetical protein
MNVTAYYLKNFIKLTPVCLISNAVMKLALIHGSKGYLLSGLGKCSYFFAIINAIKKIIKPPFRS